MSSCETPPPFFLPALWKDMWAVQVPRKPAMPPGLDASDGALLTPRPSVLCLCHPMASRHMAEAQQVLHGVASKSGKAEGGCFGSVGRM